VAVMSAAKRGELFLFLFLICLIIGAFSLLLYFLIDTDQKLDLMRERKEIIEQELKIVEREFRAEQEHLVIEKQELMSVKEYLTITKRTLATTEQRLIATQEKFVATEKELVVAREKLVVIEQKLVATEQELADARRRLATPLSTVSAVRNEQRKIALTFDDGPVRGWTDRYLRVLEDYGIVATFFLTGRMVEGYPAGLRNILEAGHEVGNHSHTHRLLTNLSEEEVSWELSHSNKILLRHGEIVPTTFRPPFGGRNRQIDAIAQAQGMRTIMWDVDPQDWRGPTAEEMVQDVLSRTRSGSIILFHEGRSNTLAALPPIIRGLQERGFQFVTVSTLLKQQGK